MLDINIYFSRNESGVFQSVAIGQSLTEQHIKIKPNSLKYGVYFIELEVIF